MLIVSISKEKITSIRIITCNYIVKYFNTNEWLDENYNLIQKKFLAEKIVLKEIIYV